MGADVVGWATVHGVRVPGGDLEAVWRLVTENQERAEHWAGLLGGSAEPDGSGDWVVITDAPTLRVLIKWASGSVVGFWLLWAPGRVIGLDLGPWTVDEVFGPNTAARLAGWTLGDLGARVVIVKHRGGGFVRHLAPALSQLTPVDAWARQPHAKILHVRLPCAVPYEWAGNHSSLLIPVIS